MIKEGMNITKFARKSVFEYWNEICIRKDTGDAFYVPMGLRDPVQVTDLVGMYILSKFNVSMPEVDGGLYRNDALFIIRSDI